MYSWNINGKESNANVTCVWFSFLTCVWFPFLTCVWFLFLCLLQFAEENVVSRLITHDYDKTV